MNVCFPFVGDTIGGSHVSALELIEGLHGSDVSPVLVLHRDGRLADYLNHQGLAYRRIFLQPVEARSIFGLLWEALFRVPKIIRFLTENEIRVVHTNDMRCHYTWLLPAWLCGVKTVLHQRTPDPGRGVRLVSLFAHRIIVVSRFIKKNSKAKVGRKASVIYNPVTVDHGYRHSISVGSLLPRNITFVGNMASRKRPYIFLQMAKQLYLKYGSAVKFQLVGELRGGYVEGIRAAVAELGLDDCVSVMGSVHPIEPILARSAVYVAPAVNEGFGRTLVEAMALGIPVVASNSGGHTEIIDDMETGLLVDADNVDLFVAAVSRLIEEPELASSLAQAAEEKVRREFSIERHVEQIKHIYEDLTGATAATR